MEENNKDYQIPENSYAVPDGQEQVRQMPQPAQTQQSWQTPQPAQTQQSWQTPQPAQVPGPQYRIIYENRVWPIVLAAVAAAILTFVFSGMIFGAMLRRAQKPAQNAAPAGDEQWENKLNQIKELIDEYYIGEVDEDKLADAAAAGMIEGIGDEWSYYIPAEEYASYQEAAANSYVGIGVTISIENVDHGVEIIDVTPNSPAYEAGLQIGDLVVGVEGVPVLDGSEGSLDLTETKNRVRGAANTQVRLTIERNGEDFDVTITRAKIKTVNVTWELLDNGIAYIRIRNFELEAAQDSIDAIKAAMERGASSLLFDVRFNPGGYKHELVKLLDYLLPEGVLFRSVDYTGRESVDRSDASHIELPMAVLVNYDSYSAAEFFAAALQEYGAAKIVGEQTYGKGRFQVSMDLDDGSAINLSIGQYTTPNGVSLVGKGITPDYPVELTDEQKADLYYSRLDQADDAQLQKAVEVLTASSKPSP